MGVLFLLLVLIVGYTYFQTRTLVAGPSINLEYPTDGATVRSGLVKVIGRATNISSLYLNNRPIYTDSYGYFEEKLLVPYGYSILELTARDRFDRVVKKSVRVIYK